MSRLDAEQIVEVVMALTGEIEAYGETYADEKSYKNQKVLEQVIFQLVHKLYENTFYAKRPEGSMKEIGEEAKAFLKELADEYGEL